VHGLIKLPVNTKEQQQQQPMQTTHVRGNAFMGESGDKYEETVYERY